MLIALAGLLHSKQVTVLEGLMKPQFIAVDDTQLYITEDTAIYIYSLKDYVLKKKFGKSGEGPGEFSRFAFVQPRTGELLINSRGKLSFFSKTGEYRKELKTTGGFGGAFYLPIGQKYIAQGFKQVEKAVYITYNLHDTNLVKTKEFHKTLFPRNQEKINPLTVKLGRMNMKTDGEQIYVADDAAGEIHVFGPNGKRAGMIKMAFQQLPVKEAHKKAMLDEYQLNPTTKNVYAQVKDRIAFPKVFPYFYDYFPLDGVVYVLTYKRAENRAEFLVYSPKGKLLRKLIVPFFQTNMHLTYPHALHKGKIYQIAEDDEAEEWLLHISELK